jgi:hypothetical protein
VPDSCADEKQAWQDYLKVTRDVPPESYAEVEPWAWSRLRRQLRKIQKRREKVTA